MSTEKNESIAVPATGLIAGLAAVAKNTFGLLLSRLELAALELSEVRDQVLKLALVFALAILAAWFAIAYGSVLVVFLLWESLGWTALLIMMLGFASLAACLLFYAYKMTRKDKLSLPTTMLALKADHDMLM